MNTSPKTILPDQIASLLLEANPNTRLTKSNPPSGYFCERQVSVMGAAVDAVCKKLGLASDSRECESVAMAAVWQVSQNAVDVDQLIALLTAQFAPAMREEA